jgi:hypothetical protein
LDRPVARESSKVRQARIMEKKETKKQMKTLLSKQGKKRKKRGSTRNIVLEVPEDSPRLWTDFNYPLQSDVLIASLRCRKPFNKWNLLGAELAKPGCRAASKKDVCIIQHATQKRRFAAFIGSAGIIYYPPAPDPCWYSGGYFIEDEKVWFNSAQLARRYTVMSFLLKKKSPKMEEWFNKILSERKAMNSSPIA